MKEQLLKILGLGAGLGILLTVASIALGWDFAVVSYYYWRVALVALVLIAVGYTAYYLYKMRKLKPVMKLFEERKYDEFVGEMKHLLGQTRNEQMQAMMKLNLGAGYLEQNAYDRTIRLYEEMDPEQLNSKQLRLVYYLNLMIAYFELGEVEKFETLYEAHGDLLERFEENQSYRAPIAQVAIYREILKNDWASAKRQLKNMRSKPLNPRYQRVVEEIDKMIEERAGDL